MTIPIHLYKLKRILRDQWSLLVSIGVFVLLSVIIFVFYSRFNTQKTEVESVTGEVQKLKNRFDTLRYNNSLTENKIKEYNKLLVSLVPETEDFFSIIYALEEISSVSQFNITDYTIDVAKTNNEKLTLAVEGKGNPEAFLAFLQDYQFAGGRLVTSNKIQYINAAAGSTRIALNFYNKKYAFNESSKVPQISKKDIDKLEAIKQKIKFQFNSSEYQSVSSDYPQKKNPFSADQ